MKSLTRHLKILITLLLIVGLGTIYYEHKVLEIPMTEDTESELWTIDAKLSYQVPGNVGVTARFYVPDTFKNYELYTDSLVSSKEYGRVIEEDDLGNKIAHYSVRRAEGTETLYYRLSLAPKMGVDETPFKYDARAGKVYQDKIALEGADKLAATALVEAIRSRSSNTATFISEAIVALTQTDNDQVKALLKGDDSPANRAKVLKVLLSQAHIPVQRVNTIQLIDSTNQKPEIWVRSYIESSKRDEASKKVVTQGKWVYFDLTSGKIGLPHDRIIWSIGDEPLLSVANGTKVKLEFNVDNKALSAITLASSTADKEGYLANSLYSLPVKMHHDYEVMIMIPFGVLVVLLVRNIIGFQTLGTFTPVLIALAFRETGLSYGIILFTVIVTLGLSLRSYLEHLKLQMLSRLSVVLTFVVILIGVLTIFSYKMGIESGLAISLFPMVILTMTIERLSITWEERGGGNAFKIAIGTLISASMAFALMGYRPLIYFVFTFPGILLVLVAFMLAMGRYRGYRLTELGRFSAMIRQEKEVEAKRLEAEKEHEEKA